MQIDPAFRSHRQSARRRRNRQRAAQAGILAGLLALLILVGTWLWPNGAPPAPDRVTAGNGTDAPDTATASDGPDGPDLAAINPAAHPAADPLAEDQIMMQVEEEFDLAPVVRADTFTDIPGDPLILTLPTAGDDARGQTQLPGPPTLDVGRVGLPAPDRLTVVNEDLYVRERRLMTALPTSREDFALFQAQRSRAILAQGETEGGETAPIDPLLVDQNEAEQITPTSNTVFLRPESERQALSRELIIDLALDTSLEDLLEDNGFDEAEAQRVTKAATPVLPAVEKPLSAGSVVALRFAPDAQGPRLMQMSLYDPKGWQGSVARRGAGDLVSATDPWLDDDIMILARGGEDEVAAGTQFRLLDVLYSAAIRAQVPTELVGETIAIMSQVHDLDSFAAEGDRLTLIFARDHGAGGQLAGQVLYAGIDGPSGHRACYVVPRDDGAGFRCFAPGARVVATSGGQDLTMPVAGTMRRKFGAQDAGGGNQTLPGVDFDVAEGAPVTVAAAGRVVSAGKDGSTGLTVTVDHGGGLITRYAGLGTLADGVAKDADLVAGAPIGSAGRPEGADAPGLFFQTLLNGTPVDPMPYFTGGTTVLASDAVETLIGRIIRVESAGNARAKNPLSTATGLGQFIESTWLRMMRSYRPDLTASMSRADLLALRFNPDLSREMVKHLAQENEAYLRARGHAISAGRLYLAHFLGPEGASRVLSSADGQTVLSVMGSGVVGANPFLSGYSIAQLKSWADRKMQSAPVAAATPEPTAEAPPSPVVTAFVDAMDDLLAQAGAERAPPADAPRD